MCGIIYLQSEGGIDLPKILVVDDDTNMLNLIQMALKKDGYQVDIESNSINVQPEGCKRYDLILLDVMMPQEDGFSVCSRIREEVDCPILFLTAKSEDADVVQGFGMGADDYIKKPFSVAELRARVNAHLRRQLRQPTHTLSRNGVCFDMKAKIIRVDGEHIAFTKGEYAICEYLVLHAGQVFTKEQLYDYVFGFDSEGNPATIAEHIKNIRAKLKHTGSSPIETVWGVGYKWKKDNIQ